MMYIFLFITPYLFPPPVPTRLIRTHHPSVHLRSRKSLYCPNFSSPSPLLPASTPSCLLLFLAQRTDLPSPPSSSTSCLLLHLFHSDPLAPHPSHLIPMDLFQRKGKHGQR